jgi:hypothetical protein
LKANSLKELSGANGVNAETFIKRFLKEYKVVSFAGIDKNSGKTTALNKVISVFQSEVTFGLTSIGIDGEETDQVTNTPKPRIFVPKGTIFATARNLLRSCDVTKEILDVTDINTPIGEVIIIKAHSAGYIEISGPSTAMQSRIVIDKMKRYGATKILVDGALSRKSHAVPMVSDCVIISAGASVSPDMTAVIEITGNLLNKLKLEQLQDKIILKAVKKTDSETKIVVFNTEGKKVYKSCTNSFADAGRSISDAANRIFINGAVLDSSVESLIKNIDRSKTDIKKVQIIVHDGTKLFIKPDLMGLLKKLGIGIRAVNTISVPFITANPHSPQGHSFNKSEFVKALGKKTKTSVIDVVGGDQYEANA